MKGRDWIALAADRAWPGPGRALLADGQRHLATAGTFDVGSALGDEAIATAYGHFAASLRARGLSVLVGIDPEPDCRALFHIVAARRPAAVLEIGTHVGASTLHIAAALDHAGGGVLTTVDIADVNDADGPWSTIGTPAAPGTLLERLGLADRVRFRHCPSSRYFAAQEERFDLVWVDGSHSEGPAFFDIRHALGALRPAGLVALHDVYADGAGNPGVRRATERLARAAPWLRVQRLDRLPFAPDFPTSMALCVRRGGAPPPRRLPEETGS